MKKLRFLLLLSTLFLVLACDDINQQTKSTTGPNVTDSEWLSINPATVAPESEFEISLKPTHKIEIINAHIVGVSMYMGRIPLFFEQIKEGKYKALGMVGVCSEKEMEWQIQIIYKDLTSQQQKTARLNFVATNL